MTLPNPTFPTHRPSLHWLLIAASAQSLLACGASQNVDPADAAVVADASRADAAPACFEGIERDFPLVTEDGVQLIADYYAAATVGAPAVVLLHMTPPQFSKADFRQSFISQLTAAGFQVLNINRRGATGSEGNANDAFFGPLGRLDAQAGLRFVVGVCGAPASQVAIVGASNGSTTALDFTVEAETNDSFEKPAALVFLSGGPYTEQQHTIASSAAVLSGIPMFFGYPSDESTWNEQVQATAPDSWEFHSYRPNAHGAFLLTSGGAAPDVLAFLSNALGL